MKTLSLVSILLGAVGLASSASACPNEQYRNHHIALDADGVLTRSEARPVANYDFGENERTEWRDVVVDKIKLESGDEVRLNAAPSMVDASVHVTVKRSSQKSDSGGIFHTTYTVRETMTSGWTGQKTEKVALVTVKSTYLGGGKRARGCGSVVVKHLPNSTVPAARR